MSKKTLFTFGLVLVAMASISMSDASRYAYHLYQNSNYYADTRGSVRTVTDRIAPISNTRNRVSYSDYVSGNTNQDVYHLSGVENAHKYAPGYLGTDPFSPRANQGKSYGSTGHPGSNVRIENTFQSNRLVVRNGNYKEIVTPVSTNTNTYNNQSRKVNNTNYTFSNTGFQKDSSGVYRSRNTATAFRVTKSQTNQCNSQNFADCVSNITQTFITGQNIQSLTNQTGKIRNRQTNYLDRNYYPTITESFDAIKNGKAYTYFVFSALDPSNNQVIRIEAVVSTHNKNEASLYMSRVFESFRF